MILKRLADLQFANYILIFFDNRLVDVDRLVHDNSYTVLVNFSISDYKFEIHPASCFYLNLNCLKIFVVAK